MFRVSQFTAHSPRSLRPHMTYGSSIAHQRWGVATRRRTDAVGSKFVARLRVSDTDSPSLRCPSGICPSVSLLRPDLRPSRRWYRDVSCDPRLTDVTVSPSPTPSVLLGVVSGSLSLSSSQALQREDTRFYNQKSEQLINLHTVGLYESNLVIRNIDRQVKNRI